MPKIVNNRTSIVFDEINATANRVQMVAMNSSDPVEKFLAYQLLPIIGNIVADVTSMLANPEIDRVAKEFADSAQKSPKPE